MRARWLKGEAFDGALRDHLARGGAVGGICGGFQMLGRVVADPHGMESGGEESGLGLLPASTVLESPKVTRRVTARLLPGPWGGGSGISEAYEIHMGRTIADPGLAPLFSIPDAGGERADGLATPDGRVWGTYLHGSLDAPEVRRVLLGFVGGLRVGPGSRATADYRQVRERAYEALAGALREALDLDAIRRLAGF